MSRLFLPYNHLRVVSIIAYKAGKSQIFDFENFLTVEVRQGPPIARAIGGFLPFPVPVLKFFRRNPLQAVGNSVLYPCRQGKLPNGQAAEPPKPRTFKTEQETTKKEEEHNHENDQSYQGPVVGRS